jgi:phage terminase small subunit
MAAQGSRRPNKNGDKQCQVIRISSPYANNGGEGGLRAMPRRRHTTKDTVDGIKALALGDHNLTVKQERFIHEYLETGCASEAYRRAYNALGMKPNVIHVKASELLANGKVAVRVRQLQGMAAERAVLTAETILGELEQARLLALQLKQPSAMVAASMGRAKIAGLVVDKKEVGTAGQFDHMTDAELRQHLIEEAQALGIAMPTQRSYPVD